MQTDKVSDMCKFHYMFWQYFVFRFKLKHHVRELVSHPFSSGPACWVAGRRTFTTDEHDCIVAQSVFITRDTLSANLTNIDKTQSSALQPPMFPMQRAPHHINNLPRLSCFFTRCSHFLFKQHTRHGC